MKKLAVLPSLTLALAGCSGAPSDGEIKERFKPTRNERRPKLRPWPQAVGLPATW